MQSTLHLLHDDPLGSVLILAGLLLAVALVVLPLTVGILYGAYYLLTLPMRRNERTRQLLEILEVSLHHGQPPEQAIRDVARSGDRSYGNTFRRLATHLEQGEKLGRALELEPAAAPRQVVALLRAGERLGNLGTVLPAARHLLRDGLSQVTAALNYLIVLCFCVTPFMIAVPLVFRFKVMPVFTAVFEEMGSPVPLPYFTRIVFGMSGEFTLIASLLLALGWLLLLGYVGGPQVRRIFRKFSLGAADASLFRLPWRRHRLQRDFSSLLAVLLDAAIPEAEAVKLAADATDNRVMTARAARVCQQLAGGTALPDALRELDAAGELQWRITNARHGPSGFRAALAGWHEALDARAYQQEQAAAQLLTTGLVLCNGVLVAAFVFAVYLALIGLIQQATLW
jgi:type II secretory pathway component PulF